MLWSVVTFAKCDSAALQHCGDADQVQRLLDSLSQPGSTQKVLKLHLEAFWTAHGNKVIGALGVVMVYYLW